MEKLKKEKWLDYRTKQVEMQVLLYNGNVDIYTRIIVTFDFTLGGRIHKWVSVESLEIRNMYETRSDYIRLGFECAFVVFLLVNWRSLVDDVCAEGCRSFCRRPNNLVNIIGQVMYCFNIALWVIICLKMHEWMIPTTENYGDAYLAINHANDLFEELYTWNKLCVHLKMNRHDESPYLHSFFSPPFVILCNTSF